MEVSRLGGACASTKTSRTTGSCASNLPATSFLIETFRRSIATGFLRLGTWNDEPNDPEDYKYERLEDLVHVTTTAFLGMTVKCARCHDHKFDPIPQTDYYRIAAAFWPGPIEPRDRALLGGPTRNELGFDVLGWTDVTTSPSDFHLLKKGEYNHPGPVVAPGVLSMITSLDQPFSAPPPGARTTQRRLKLAEWITDPRHPLAARVYVNRLWQHHFGRGLVSSPNNFGFNGQKPSHPELLDWLADEFVRGGWKSKRLHYLDDDVASLPAIVRSSRSKSHMRRRTPTTSFSGGAHGEGRMPKRFATRSWLRAAGSTCAWAGRASSRRSARKRSRGSRKRAAISFLRLRREQGRRSLYMYSRRGLVASAPDDIRLLRHDPAVRSARCERGGAAGAGLDERRVRARAKPGRGGPSRRAVRGRTVRLASRCGLAARAGSSSEQDRARGGNRITSIGSAGQFRGDPRADDLALASLCHVLINSNEFIFVD